jgi:hypothetical protein
MARRTFDGRDDLIEMEVPVVGRRSGVVLLQGEGLPDLVGIGAHDLPPETWLSIENRSRRGPLYERVRHVRQGVLHLAGTISKGAYLTGGHTYGHGKAAADKAEEPGEIIVAEPGSEAVSTAAWLGVREDGTAFLLTADMQWDSFDLREALEQALSGDFHIQHGSCPWAWCSLVRATTITGLGRDDQAAIVGRLTRGSSPIGAMLSRVM